MFDTSQHRPYGHGTIIERGLLMLRAWEPAVAAARQVVVIQAFTYPADEFIREVKVPLSVPLTMTVVDHRRVERATEDLIHDVFTKGVN